MPTVSRPEEHSLILKCDDESDTFVAKYTNQGEPFRSGIEIGIVNDHDHEKSVFVMLCDHEAKQLRDLLNQMYPK